jgi:hydrogenase/urease accessory protein HupE
MNTQKTCGNVVSMPALLGGIALVLLFPASAAAHLVSTGLGPFFGGVTHLAVTPEDLLPVIAVALLAGLRGKSSSRWVLFAVPLAWFVAGLLGVRLQWNIPLTVTTVSFLAFGGLVAADAKLADGAVAALAVAFGVAHGFINGVEVTTAGIGWAGLLGATVSLFVVLALATALVVSLQAVWTRIAVRVAGSWIAAIGLLLLGWSFRAPS